MYDIDINQYCHNFGSVPVVAIVTGEPTFLPFIPGETQRVHVIDKNTPFLSGNDPALQALNDMREAKRTQQTAGQLALSSTPGRRAFADVTNKRNRK